MSRPMAPLGRVCAMLAASVLALLTAATAAQSQALTPSVEEADPGRMVLVLDSSGSMKEPTGSGETKIAAAKKALREVIASLPEDQAVGLRVYGSEVFSREDPGACTDSRLVVPVETGNRGALRDAVRSYRPYGETPIGHALEQAAEDLGPEGKRTIVLVSDGEPTCPPDPCKVAGDLAAQGVDVRVDVVGLDVEGAAREKLRCIAGAGNGSYYDVDSAEEFAVSLEKLASRAARPYSAIGRPVSGTPTFDDAPTITAGDWRDTFGTTETELVNNYLVERRIPGSTVHVSAAVRTATGAAETIDVDLTTADGLTDCDASRGFHQLSAGSLIAAKTFADRYDVFGDLEPDDPCGSADALIATVQSGADEVTGPRPVEIRVVEEPPVKDTEGLPEETDDARWVEPEAGQRSTDVTGGASFADAPLLEPGTYSDDIVPGEVLTYQVEVGWGQQLSARMLVPELSERLGQVAGRADVLTRIDAYGPARGMASNTLLEDSPLNQSFLDPYGVEIGVGTAPVRYLNRAGGSDPAKGASLAGRYTVSVFLEEDPDGDSYAIPFVLRVAVTGQETAGPDYADVEPTQAPSPPSEQAAPERTTRSNEAGATAQEDSGSGFGTGLLVGGLGVVALGAVGYVVLRRRGGAA